jgi:hypothetical protein
MRARRGEALAGYAARMSKVDALQALREARYAAGQAQVAAARAAAGGRTAGASSAATAPAVAPAPSVAPAPAADRRAKGATGSATGVTAEEPGLCGHRSIGSKSCQRPAGHAEKSHRYK